MRYEVSGACAEAIVASGTDARYLLGKAITTNRVLHLRQLWVYNSHASANAVLTLYDTTEGLNPTASTAKFTVPCPFGVTTMVEFAAPGLEFKTDCVAAQDSGTVAAYQAGGLGYEVGGGGS